MKRIMIISAILLVIIAFATWGMMHTNQMQATFIADCNSIMELSPTAREEPLDHLQARWEQERQQLGRFLHHSVIDRVTDALADVLSANRIRDEVEFQMKAAEFQRLLHRLYEDELPSLDNIF